MSTIALQEDLRDFATRLFEQSGGLVEWDDDGLSGVVLAPAEVGQLLRLPESFALCSPPREPGSDGMSLSLATDFLDQAGHLLEAAVPRVGRFEVGERYLKRGDLQAAVDESFGWQNARVRVQGHGPQPVEYHTWWFAASLRSDDVWEDRLSFTINSRSGAEVSFPDLLQSPELCQSQSRPRSDSWSRDREGAVSFTEQTPLPEERGSESHAAFKNLAEIDSDDLLFDTLSVAQAIVQQRVLSAAAGFLERIEERKKRDQKKLRDYYHALLRETRAGSKRAKIVPTTEEKQTKERAVDLELRRKLSELDERYAMEAVVRPTILIRTLVPVLAIELTVQRKQATRQHVVFWNPLTKSFEPLSCSRCRASTVNVWFTNDTVEPLCRRCFE
ncbi:MAG: hypothetical protein ACKV2Q_02480 [Planctomycetaceae bacterium]